MGLLSNHIPVVHCEFDHFRLPAKSHVFVAAITMARWPLEMVAAAAFYDRTNVIVGHGVRADSILCITDNDGAPNGLTAWGEDQIHV